MQYITAVKKYSESAQVSRLLTIPDSSYHLHGNDFSYRTKLLIRQYITTCSVQSFDDMDFQVIYATLWHSHRSARDFSIEQLLVVVGLGI